MNILSKKIGQIARYKQFQSVQITNQRILQPYKKLFNKLNPNIIKNLHTFQNAIPEQDRVRADIRNLGSMLGQIIKAQDESVFETVEKLRYLSRSWRDGGDDKQIFKQITEYVAAQDNEHLLGVARAFTHYLALLNSVETHDLIRNIRKSLIEQDSDSPFQDHQQSTTGTIQMLIKDYDKSPYEIMDALLSQQVELVLTAHPTEVNRRTLIRKHHKIQGLLEENDRQDLLKYEKKQLQSSLYSEINSIWNSDELNRAKPTPIDEAKTGLAVIENVLWDAVPKFFKGLDYVLKEQLGKQLPLDCSIIKIASWIGGDRDGNPNVTPEITFHVSTMSRLWAAKMYKKEIVRLQEELSITTCNKEIRKLVGESREPYRFILHQLEERLDATIDWAYAHLKKSIRRMNIEPIFNPNELLQPLMKIHKSLTQTNNEQIANDQLLDIIRKIQAFGMNLAPLDIRQESSRHKEALNAITKFLGVGNYSEWEEEQKIKWLVQELKSKRPLLPRSRKLQTYEDFSPTVLDTLKTFQLISELKEGSLGAYVISHCQRASDVLAVLLLQQDAGVSPELRVVPLFETLNDLQRSAQTMEQLFSIQEYVQRINKKQEIMVGYSDSAKDAGRLACSWVQYTAQEQMVEVAQKAGIDLTFFHGKGGSVGRGGNQAVYTAILAHPPNTINGRFRVTEQGEMITQKFGKDQIAVRTLDLYTAGVLAEKFVERPSPKKSWVEVMEFLSEISCKDYRQVVREEQRFVPYFRLATPEQELSSLNIGSRPAKRNPTGGVESLRAIPWVFAWTQTRLNLPTWLGVGHALQEAEKKYPGVLKEMYQQWPWFRVLIDLLEMILMKSESIVSENYDKVLIKDENLLSLGEELREKMKLTEEMIVFVTGGAENNKQQWRMIRKLKARDPYIDPLNVIQAELLKRLRDPKIDKLPEEEQQILRDALLITINGIANGMQNSG